MRSSQYLCICIIIVVGTIFIITATACQVIIIIILAHTKHTRKARSQALSTNEFEYLCALRNRMRHAYF